MILSPDMPKQRIIQEYVPGKQITLAHIIASPERDICVRLGLDEKAQDALGLFTIVPPDSVIIAADVATKAGNVEIGYLDRFGGSLLITGDVAAVESGVTAVLEYFSERLRYDTVEMTRT